MVFNIFKKQRSIIFSWLTSYISVLLVPIIISGLIYAETGKTVQKQINRSNTFALKRIQQHIDGLLSDIDRVSTEVCFNNRIREMLDYMEPGEDSFNYTIYKIRQELKLYKLANGAFVDMFIYFKDRGIILSSNTSLDGKGFYSMVFGGDQGYDGWISTLNVKHKGDYVLFPEKAENEKQYKSIAFIRSIPLYKQDEVVNFVIMVDESKFVRETGGFEMVSGGTALIMDSDSNIITSSDSDADLYESLKYNRFTGNEGIFFDNLADRKMAVSFISSGVNSWKYISAVPAVVYWDQAQYVRKLTLASILLCIIFGGLVAYVFLRRNYKPVRDLLNLFTTQADLKYEKEDNEFKYIKEAVNKAFDEKLTISRKLSEQNKGLRSNFLSRLLKGYERKGVHLEDLFQAYDINFESDYFGVVVFYINNLSGMIEQYNDLEPGKCVELVQFIIKNVVEELAGQNNKGYVAEVDQLMACIINFKEENLENWQDEINRITDETCEFFRRHYDLELMAAASEMHETIMGIPQAYAEAVEVIEYKRVTGNESVTNYGDIAGKQKEEYYYPLEKEYQLINCIKAGDFSGAKLLLVELFENNFNGKTPSIQIVRCMMFDMMSTMIKTVNVISSIYKNDFLEELNPVDALLKCQNIGQMKAKMLEIAERVCEYVSENSEKVSYSIRDKVIEYVQCNYSDVNLGNSTIAEYLGMNPNYVSTAFKTQAGEGLSDYINLVRINKAKDLIEAGEVTVEDVANAVGYTSTHTFIRVFKKYEGITPGKYRDSYLSKADRGN